MIMFDAGPMPIVSLQCSSDSCKSFRNHASRIRRIGIFSTLTTVATFTNVACVVTRCARGVRLGIAAAATVLFQFLALGFAAFAAAAATESVMQEIIYRLAYQSGCTSSMYR